MCGSCLALSALTESTLDALHSTARSPCKGLGPTSRDPERPYLFALSASPRQEAPQMRRLRRIDAAPQQRATSGMSGREVCMLSVASS